MLGKMWLIVPNGSDTVTPMPSKMRRSRVLAKMRAGEVTISFGLNLGSARAAEIAAMHGYDCLWLKMEHTASDWSVIEGQIRAAKLHDADTVVRVARGSYSDYIRPLELDATGIMVPHVMSAEDVRAIVRMTRFHPLGLRPLDGGNADGAFCNMPIDEYVRQSNDQRFVAIQIEDREAMDDLDAMCEVEGIDIIFFGSLDFSHSLGAPAQWNDPRLVAARKRIAEVALQHGKFPGTTASVQNCGELMDLGYRFINIGGDVSALNTYCRDAVTEFARLHRERRKGY